jgi:hypothetical protein
MAFQIARSKDEAGVGYGILIMDLSAGPAESSSPAKP